MVQLVDECAYNYTRAEAPHGATAPLARSMAALLRERYAHKYLEREQLMGEGACKGSLSRAVVHEQRHGEQSISRPDCGADTKEGMPSSVLPAFDGTAEVDADPVSSVDVVPAPEPLRRPLPVSHPLFAGDHAGSTGGTLLPSPCDELDQPESPTESPGEAPAAQRRTFTQRNAEAREFTPRAEAHTNPPDRGIGHLSSTAPRVQAYSAGILSAAPSPAATTMASGSAGSILREARDVETALYRI